MSGASSISSLHDHDEFANELAHDAPQPDRARPVAHANTGKDIEQVVDPEHAAENTAQNSVAKHDWQLLCGPMLKYSRLSEESSRWHGSIMIVLRAPDDSIASNPDEPSISIDAPGSKTETVHLFTERDRVYWRFSLELALGDDERQVQYAITLPGHSDKMERSFWVPKVGQTFRIMFHRCGSSHVLYMAELTFYVQLQRLRSWRGQASERPRTLE